MSVSEAMNTERIDRDLAQPGIIEVLTKKSAQSGGYQRASVFNRAELRVPDILLTKLSGQKSQ
jgi:hypothetical protein